MDIGFLIFIVVLLVMLSVIIISKCSERESVEREFYKEDGFLNPHIYHVGVTDHARERMSERLGIYDCYEMDRLALQAYKFGKSARQADIATAIQIHEIEERYGTGIVLLYRGFVYIFSRDNSLITVYKNDRMS